MFMLKQCLRILKVWILEEPIFLKPMTSTSNPVLEMHFWYFWHEGVWLNWEYILYIYIHISTLFAPWLYLKMHKVSVCYFSESGIFIIYFGSMYFQISVLRFVRRKCIHLHYLLVLMIFYAQDVRWFYDLVAATVKRPDMSICLFSYVCTYSLMHKLLEIFKGTGVFFVPQSRGLIQIFLLNFWFK